MAGEVGLPEELVDAAYTPELHTQLDVTLGADRLAALADFHDHLLEHGFLDRPLDLDDLVVAGPLATAIESRQRATVPARH